VRAPNLGGREVNGWRSQQGETVWNVLVARIFSLDRARRGYIGLKSVIDRVFGGLLARLSVKIAST
jgi:hypothetical protein